MASQETGKLVNQQVGYWPGMQDTCGAWESLATSNDERGIEKSSIGPSGPHAAVSQRHPERELLTVYGNRLTGGRLVGFLSTHLQG